MKGDGRLVGGTMEQRWNSFGRIIKLDLAARNHGSVEHYTGDLSHQDRAEILARCDQYRSNNEKYRDLVARRRSDRWRVKRPGAK